MDAHTLELLEFSKIREIVAGYAMTTLGKELARSLRPSTDLDALRQAHLEVTEMVEALLANQAPPLGGLSDIRLLVRRASIGSMLSASELLQVKEVLACTGQMYRYRSRLSERWQGLQRILVRIEDMGSTAQSISGCVDDRGHLLDMASPELGRIRHLKRQLDDRIQSQIKRLLRDAEFRKILRYPSATTSGEHHVFPVAANYRHKVPGIIHRTSATGDTVFIEPSSVAQISAERALITADENKEESRILRQLTSEVAKVSRPLLHAIDVLTQMDLLYAKGRFSAEYRHFAPELNHQGRLWLRQVRHPILEHLQRFGLRQAPLSTVRIADQSNSRPAIHTDAAVVPIDVRLGMEFDILIITGPNTGGKTVALKTVGLVCLMAQCGLHIPAGEGSQVPLHEDILADIGDEQSLEQSLSTFSSHVSRIAFILGRVNPRALVLLDELGAGTDPSEGAALGQAILDELRQSGCRAMVTTHLGDLKNYALKNDRVENAAVEFDIESLKPTYRLLLGQFGMSNALQIARRLGLSKSLMRRAKFYLHRKQRKSQQVKELHDLREKTASARQQALEAERQAQRERELLEEKQRAVEQVLEEARRLEQWRRKLQPGKSVCIPQYDRPGKVVRVDMSRGLVVVKAGIGQWEVPLSDVQPETS